MVVCLQDLVKKSVKAECIDNDMKVNADGRQMAQSGQYRSAYEACDKYRPAGYDPLDRFRYYKK